MRFPHCVTLFLFLFFFPPQKLLEAVRDKGEANWKEVAKDFPNRTRSQCRQRFMIIFKSYKKSTQKFSLHALSYDNEHETRQKKGHDDLYKRYNARLNDFLRQHKVKNEITEKINEESETAHDEAVRMSQPEYHITPDGVSLNLFIFFQKFNIYLYQFNFSGQGTRECCAKFHERAK